MAAAPNNFLLAVVDGVWGIEFPWMFHSVKGKGLCKRRFLTLLYLSVRHLNRWLFEQDGQMDLFRIGRTTVGEVRRTQIQQDLKILYTSPFNY